MPEKSQKIPSVVVGYGAADKIGEAPCQEEYEKDLQLMAEEYQNRDNAGECFVHIRERHSSNRDLSALRELSRGGKIRSVNLRGKEAESILTNSAHLAKMIEKAECDSSQAIEKAIGKGIKGKDWKANKIGFEQHMLEEDSVRLDWQRGKSEEDRMRCETCGDKNAWDKVHRCCEDQCTGILNALQAFPFAAWDDMSAARLDPLKVVAVRKLEIEYAEKKPAWKKVPRCSAKKNG